MAEPDVIATPSTERATAPCAHFGVCGGCTLQHWNRAPYLNWKAEQLALALRRAGYPDPPIAPPLGSDPGERRRVDLAIRRTRSGIVLGLHRLRAAEVVDLSECHVLDSALQALLRPLREALVSVQALRREGSAIVNLLDDGADLLLRTDGALTSADRLVLTGFAQTQGLCRISWAEGRETPQTACQLRPSTITLSGVLVAPPPGAFLQATRTGEAAIVGSVISALPDGLGPREKVAELYAGCGTLTFALANRARISAWEGDPASADALRQAVNRAGLHGRIEPRCRDLARQPLQRTELVAFEAVVLDPPHDGAAVQMAEIAGASTSCVIYVSCNPAALGRDAAVLRQAGWRLQRVQPIDQFLWSARVESVTVFVR